MCKERVSGCMKWVCLSHINSSLLWEADKSPCNERKGVVCQGPSYSSNAFSVDCHRRTWTSKASLQETGMDCVVLQSLKSLTEYNSPRRNRCLLVLV